MTQFPSESIVKVASATSYPVFLEQIRNALVQAQDLESSMTALKTTRALEEVVKCGEVSHEIKVQAAELRIRWERRVGLAMKEAPKNRGVAGTAKGRISGGIIVVPPEKPDPTPTYSELGIKKNHASRYRALAEMDEEEFEETLNQRATLAYQEASKAVSRSLSTNAIVREQRKKAVGDKPPEFSPIIKPSDNWNFSAIAFDRIGEDQADTHGYIPGDLYANCLWYWTKDGDRVVAPMAGSGMIQHVWNCRDQWMVGDTWDIELMMLDLNPRGPFKDLIQANDLTQGLPVEGADYIVMDVPYFGMVNGQYSDKGEDIANAMDFGAWCSMMGKVARSCVAALTDGGRCSVITPNYRDLKTRDAIAVTYEIALMFEDTGLELIDKAYSSRRIQQSQTPTMARLNNQAKRTRTMLTDMAEILTFENLPA